MLVCTGVWVDARQGGCAGAVPSGQLFPFSSLLCLKSMVTGSVSLKCSVVMQLHFKWLARQLGLIRPLHENL